MRQPDDPGPVYKDKPVSLLRLGCSVLAVLVTGLILWLLRAGV